MRKWVLIIVLVCIAVILIVKYIDREPSITKIIGNKYYLSDGSYAIIATDELSSYVRYVKYDADGIKFDEGQLENGKFISDYDEKESWLQLLSGSLLLLCLFLYTIFLLPGDVQRLKDYRRKNNAFRFSSLSAEEQRKIIGTNLFCSRCEKDPQVEIIREVNKNEMHMLELKCRLCEEVKTIRVK